MADEPKSERVGAKSKRPIEYKGIDIPRFYANNVTVSGSPWDLRLTFGQIDEADASHMVITNQATIYMSPAHAKAFLNLLNKKIKDFEAQFPTWQPGMTVEAADEEEG